jgi:hypothetical protein
MTDEEPSKICAKCKVLKSVAEFYKSKGMKDGLQGKCKACVIQCQKEHNETRTIEEVSSKVCTKCKVLKSAAEFRNNKQTKDGLQGRCRVCHKEYKDSYKERCANNRYGEEISHKICTKCKLLKYRSEFSNDCSTKDGLQYTCKDCARQYADEHISEISAQHKGYHAAHRESILRTQKEYYDTHRDSLLEKKRYYASENRERRIEYGIKWKLKNPERAKAWRKANTNRVNLASATRRAAKKSATPIWFEKEAILELYAESSARSMSEGVKYHVDHIVPLQSELVCGLHCLANLQIITATENHRKNNRYWPGQKWIIHP